MVSSYVKWGDAEVKLTWQANKWLPSDKLVTSAHGFCFYKEKMLLVDLKHRGWDFPGGHIEVGETPEESIHREALEEGYVSGNCQLVGYIMVDHSDNPIWDEKGRYPKIGYQAFYKMDINMLHPFKAGYESSRRVLLTSDEVPNTHHDWNELYQEILSEAINLK